jgi:hypothetical protein
MKRRLIRCAYTAQHVATLPLRHARPCAGHPRLSSSTSEKQTWMAGTSPAMTPRVDPGSSEHALAIVGQDARRWFKARLGIGPAPAAVTPRQIPARMPRQCWGNEIETGRPEGLAPAKPSERHPAAGPQAEAADRLPGIAGAGGQMAAVESHEGGECQTVGADQSLRDQPGAERQDPKGVEEFSRGHQRSGRIACWRSGPAVPSHSASKLGTPRCFLG